MVLNPCTIFVLKALTINYYKKKENNLSEWK